MALKVGARGRDKNVGDTCARQPRAEHYENPAQQVSADSALRRAGTPVASPTRRDILQLQRTVGNRAVGRVLEGAASPPRPPQPKPTAAPGEHLGATPET